MEGCLPIFLLISLSMNDGKIETLDNFSIVFLVGLLYVNVAGAADRVTE